MDGVSIGSETKNRSYLLPRLKIKNSSSGRVQPFLEVDGVLTRYNYCDLVGQNPYVLGGFTTIQNGVEYNFCAGIEGGDSKGRFSYRLFGDYTIAQNAIFWTLNEEQVSATDISNFYTAQFGDLCTFAIGGDLEYTPVGDLKFDLGASLYGYNVSGVDGVSVSRPYSMVNFGGEYTLNRVRFGASVDLKGVSYTTLYTAEFDSVGDLQPATKSTIKTNTSIDLKLFAEVELNNKMVLFIEGDNLTNSKQYKWAGYRDYGVGVMAGVKFQF